MTVIIFGAEVNILAQIIDLMAVFILILSYQGGKRKYLLLSSVSSVFFCAESLVLSAYSNVVCNIVTIIRNLAIAYCDKKKIKFPLFAIILSVVPIAALFVYMIILGDFLSALPPVIALIFTYISLQKNIYILKIGALIAECGYLVYNFYIGAYVGGIRQIIVVTSVVVALVNLIKLNKKGDKNENQCQKT